MRSFHFPGRSPVYGRQVMCATSHPLASLTAIDILKNGGNAVDAAIATAAVLAVVECPMTGIGGDCFALVAKPNGTLIALSGAGRAPAAAKAAWFANAGIRSIDTTSVHAVTVPGAVAGWCQLLEDHGTMPLLEVLAPAISLAAKGFIVAPRVALDWSRGAAKLARHAGARKHLLPDGQPPKAGEVMRFPALADTLKRIAKDGRDGFYRGPVAKDMVAELKALGGLHTLEDFAGLTASYVKPIAVGYGGLDICELPPSNHGIVALIMLKMLARLGRPRADAVSAERYHLLMETARLAFAMRDRFVADPDMADVPVEHMLSDKVIANLVDQVDPRKRRSLPGRLPTPVGSDTVCFSIVDGRGMAVSFINSLYADFGTGIATAKTGVNFHNRGQGFVLDPKHPNCIAPGKRPLHTLVPAMGMKDGRAQLAMGVMGAHFQPMGHVYVISNLMDYAMDPQEAIDMPRVFFEGDAIVVEEAVPAPVVAGLRKLGHPVLVRDLPWGGGQMVWIDRAKGVLIGASDGRKDGMALGY
jgi:gamma-glutamyltranspeptidase / glutathione hydrolase